MADPRTPQQAARSSHPTRWRRLRRALWVLPIALPLVFLLVSALGAWASIHPVRQRAAAPPSSWGSPYEDVTFSAPGGPGLKGWFVPAAKPVGAVIVCHGYPGSRASVVTQIRFFQEVGLSVLAFDFRALGQSGGDTSTIGYREVDDFLAAVAYLRQRPDTRNLKLGVYGCSMGGAVSIMGTARSPEIRAVIADSPYARLDRAISHRYAPLGGLGTALGSTTRFFGERMTGMSAAKVAPVDVVAQISPRPLLLIHGTADRIISHHDSEMLYRAAGEPKELWLEPGADHVRIYDVNPDRYTQRVTRFMRAALNGPSHASEEGE